VRGISLGRALRIKSGDVVAFTGGGGKTTAMFRLACELAPKLRVLTTTSTRIFAAQISKSPGHVIFDATRQTPDDILPVLNAKIEQFGQVLLIGNTEPAGGKAFGILPEIIDMLAATGQFEIILNEADGSRMRPFKAPAEHEPVIPNSTSVVVPVMGLDVLEMPLADDTVHRAARVSQISGLPLGAPITADTVAAVITHPQGGLKAVPANARVVPLLNKAETGPEIAGAQTIASKLLKNKKIDSVVLASVQNAQIPVVEVHRRTAAVVLAAGGSRRFGSPKQLAKWGNVTLIEQAVDTALASQARPVVVVLGAKAEACRAALGNRNRSVKIVTNHAWADGQSTSLKLGLAALPPNIGSAVFLPADQPEISADVIDAVIHRHRQTLAPVVWPEFEGQRGNPVLFDRALFPQLAQVRGDTGGRPVLLAHKNQAERVPVTNRGILLDIDHPETLEERTQ